jgi:hypothetical protein
MMNWKGRSFSLTLHVFEMNLLFTACGVFFNRILITTFLKLIEISYSVTSTAASNMRNILIFIYECSLSCTEF